jgi:hypothetical protein
VVGVSGGGDSNSLLYRLSQLADLRPDDPPGDHQGHPRLGHRRAAGAGAVCDSYGLPLRIMDEAEVKALLGIPADATPLIER